MSNAAKTAYNQRNYDQLHIWLPLGGRVLVERAAARHGESINRYVATAINAALAQDGLAVSDMRLRQVVYLDNSD